jgi:hypothetical protein
MLNMLPCTCVKDIAKSFSSRYRERPDYEGVALKEGKKHPLVQDFGSNTYLTLRNGLVLAEARLTFNAVSRT